MLSFDVAQFKFYFIIQFDLRIIGPARNVR